MTVKVYIPRDTTANALGAEDVVSMLKARIEQQSLDVEIIRNGSRGLFYLEPLVEVATDAGRVAYGPVEASDIDSLLAADFLTGNREHALCQGLTEEIPYLANQQRLTFKRAGVVDPLSIDDYRAHGGFDGLENAINLLAEGRMALVEQVIKSGLRGRGGAAFPTGIKWKTVLGAPGDEKYIVCNADEGDSGSFADRLVMEADPMTLIEGIVIAGLSVGAEKGYIYSRSEYPLVKTIFNQAIALAYEHGYLGEDICGSGQNFDLEFRFGAGAYICGEETSMIESIEGKRGLVRNKPPIPALEGLFGKPTIVNNVISLAAVPEIFAKGPECYRDFGMGRSRGTITAQLAGNVKQGGLVELAFGVSVETLVNNFGGGTLSGRPAIAAQIGGPLGAYVPVHQWQTPLDYEAFAAIHAMVGHGGIVVFDETADMAQQARFAMEFCAIESCGKCTPCRIGSVRGVEVIDKIINSKSEQEKAEQVELALELFETMELGSMCAMGGMAPHPVQSLVRHFYDDLEAGTKLNQRAGVASQES